MKFVFLGTPDYVVPVAEALNKNFREGSVGSIVAVVTQKPMPSGRNQMLKYSAIDSWAHKKGVPIFFDSRNLIEENVKADVGILASFGAFIPSDVINHFKYGIINIHPSLLPKFRGSAPVVATIIMNETPGVTFIKLDDKLDHGPIISHFKDELLENDTAETLRNRLFIRASEILLTLLPAYINGKVKPKEQDHDSATFTRELKKDDGFIPPKILEAAIQAKVSRTKWQLPFIKIDGLPLIQEPTVNNLILFIRAINPWPGAWTLLHLDSSGQPRRLKILKAHINESELVLDEVQLEGKNPVTWEQFKNGYPRVKFKE